MSNFRVQRGIVCSSKLTMASWWCSKCRTGAAAKGIDLIPRQVPPPGPDRVSRRTMSATAQSGEAQVFHFVQMENAFHAHHQREDAGQQALPQGAVVVGEA